MCFKQKWKWKVTCFTINYFFLFDNIPRTAQNRRYWGWTISKQEPEEMTLASYSDWFLLSIERWIPSMIVVYFLFRDYYCFINIFNSNYRRNNQDKWIKKCCKCVYKSKKKVKQSKNETNTRMLILYSKNSNKKLWKYLTLDRASKINIREKKTYILPNCRTHTKEQIEDEHSLSRSLPFQ